MAAMDDLTALLNTINGLLATTDPTATTQVNSVWLLRDLYSQLVYLANSGTADSGNVQQVATMVSSIVNNGVIS